MPPTPTTAPAAKPPVGPRQRRLRPQVASSVAPPPRTQWAAWLDDALTAGALLVAADAVAHRAAGLVDAEGNPTLAELPPDCRPESKTSVAT